GQALVERLAATYPGVTHGFAPSLDAEPWFLLARKLRSAADYVRFHDAEFETFRKTRLTLRERIPRGILRAMDGGAAKSGALRAAIGAVLRGSETVMPISEASRQFIETHDPDVVLMASVTSWRPPQIDHLRAARALGRRTGVCVFSWDHLSGKAMRRTVLRPLVRSRSVTGPRVVLPHGRAVSRASVSALRVLGDVADAAGVGLR